MMCFLMHKIVVALLSLVFVFSTGSSEAAELQNLDFAAGLEHWVVSESGGEADPGSITVTDGQVSFVEGGSFLMRMSQIFEVPEGLLSISIPLSLTPGFDTSANFHPDAFEISLLNGSKAPVVPVWKQLASSFLNVQETGEVSLATGVTFEDGVVTLDTSGVEEGTRVELVFALLGADSDQASSVALGPITVDIANKKPVAVAGDDQTVECDEDNELVLDASASTDPEGQPLTFSWKNSEDQELGTEATVSVSLSLGSQTFLLTVTDAEGLSDSAQVTVTLQDTTPPVLDTPPADASISADGDCAGAVPDIIATLVASDACSEDEAITLEQDVASGEALALGAPTAVTVTVSDPSGNSVQATVNVSLVDDTPPVVSEALEDLEVVADENCAGVLPEVVATVTDNCTAAENLVFSQEPAVGEALSFNESVTVTLTVSDESAQSISEETEVLMVDQTPQTITVPDDAIVVEAQEGCVLEVPQLSAEVVLADNCAAPSQLTLVQTPEAGAPLELGEEASVGLSTIDQSGNTAEAVASLRTEDTGAFCVAPPEPQPEPDPELAPPPEPDVTASCGCRLSGGAPQGNPWTAALVFFCLGAIVWWRHRRFGVVQK